MQDFDPSSAEPGIFSRAPLPSRGYHIGANWPSVLIAFYQRLILVSDCGDRASGLGSSSPAPMGHCLVNCCQEMSLFASLL